jgi:hypothetical protein
MTVVVGETGSVAAGTASVSSFVSVVVAPGGVIVVAGSVRITGTVLVVVSPLIGCS